MDKITGLMIYYYFVCKKKLWYFLQGIECERGNELISLGMMIEDEFLGNKNTHININNEINIDKIINNIVYEVKKSRAIEEASIWQLKYYLYYLETHGVKNLTGVIEYPLLKKKIEVNLTNEDQDRIEGIKKEITEIKKTKCPIITERRICKNCAYQAICQI